MIRLRETLTKGRLAFESAGIPYALIGGFALASYGIHRATQDIDFLVDGSRKDLVKKTLEAQGFRVLFESPEVMQFSGPGYLDVLLANRLLSLEMLSSAKSDQVLGIPVVSPEGLIGLKIQAYKNDPKRELQDKADIQELLKLQGIDLKLVRKFADLFDEWSVIESLKS